MALGTAVGGALEPMSKAELHAHLSGSVPSSVWLELLTRQDPTAAASLLEEDFRSVRPSNGLREYFRPWEVIREVVLDPESIRALVGAVASELALDGVAYAELRHSVVHVADKSSLAVDRTLGALLDACDLARESHGVDVRLLVSFVRHEPLEHRLEELCHALERYRDHRALVGVDLTGDEQHEIGEGSLEALRFATGGLGLPLSAHAGETGLADNVRFAIEELGARRIGHGLAAAGEPQLQELLIAEDVCVEVCLTTNRLTGHVPDLREHPVVELAAAGVPFVLCTDNPAINQSKLGDEMRLFEELFHRPDLIDDILAHQWRYAFREDVDD